MSGEGVHVIGRGRAFDAIVPSLTDGKIEAYSSRRFFTVTGRAIRNAGALEDVQPIVERLRAASTRRQRGKPETEVVRLPAGRRNSGLTSEAGRFRRLGHSQMVIEAALKALNAERCQPPLDEREVETIARSVSRYEAPPIASAGSQLPTTDSDSGRDLLLGEAPEVDWLIEGFLASSGLTLLAGRPKGGKSTLAYQMIYCATTGLPFLEAPVLKIANAVLISKDDGNRSRVRRRFQRVSRMMPGASAPDVVARFQQNMLQAFYKWEHGPEAVMQLDRILEKRPHCNLVVIDAWAAIKGRGNKSNTLFENDDDEITAVAYPKGAGDYENPIDAVQGTSGVTAATDDHMGMRRDVKNSVTILSQQGRNFDMED